MLLRQLRKNNELKMKDVAIRLGISESFLSLVEHGKRQPSYELLQQMSDLYGIEKDILQLSVGRIPESLTRQMIDQPNHVYRAICDKFEKYND